MECGIHHKPMRQNARGWYCPTPVSKDPDGKTSWCQWKPGDASGDDGWVNDVGNHQAKTNHEYAKDDVRGKIRHGIACAYIQKYGLVEPTDEDKAQIEYWIDYIETGT